MRKKSTLYLLFGIWALCLFASERAEAILFDAPEVLPPGKMSTGVVGELLLSNPSSEGVEARLKYGVTKNFSTQAILGTGSNYRKFRIGLQNTISIFPDTEGQFGVALILGGLYLRRQQQQQKLSKSVVVATAGPMIHKKFSKTFIPMNGYFAIPFGIELDNGRYYTGSQLVFGAIGDIDGGFFAIVELGLGIAAMESYVAGGAGVRF